MDINTVFPGLGEAEIIIIIIIIIIILIIIIAWIVGTKCAVTAGDNITGFFRIKFERFEYFCASWLE